MVEKITQGTHSSITLLTGRKVLNHKKFYHNSDTFILDPLQANEVAALSFLFVIVHHMIACGLVKLRIAVAMSLLKNENRNPVA